MENDLIKSPLEKASDMVRRYSGGNEDPWGNRKTQLYQRIFKKATELSYEYVKDKKVVNSSDQKFSINLYDIGCGGGNVIDTWVENKPEDVELSISGCDISNDAINYLLTRYPNGKFDCVDLEEYDSKVPLYNLAKADIVSVVDVLYYLDVKKSYRDVLDELLKTIKSGTIIVVADNLVRSFRRDYLGKTGLCELLESYTEDSEPVSVEQSVMENGKIRTWHRFLKIRVYRKI